MDNGQLIGRIILFAIIALVVTLTTRLARRTRRHEPGRAAGPAGPGGAVPSVDVPRQRPAPFMRVLGFVLLACGMVALALSALIPDTVGAIVIGLIAALIIVVGLYVLRSYQNCTLVDAPTMTIMTDWRGREKRMLHEEIVKYYAANRRTAVVRDTRGQKLSIDLVWFTAPLLARHLMQLEAEGRFAGQRIGDANRINKGLRNVEYTFRMSFPEHYKALLLQGPGANPTAFQRDPAAPQGMGWTGATYGSWLQALQSALGNRIA